MYHCLFFECFHKIIVQLQFFYFNAKKTDNYTDKTVYMRFKRFEANKFTFSFEKCFEDGRCFM
jgi:hypothetical protein